MTKPNPPSLTAEQHQRVMNEVFAMIRHKGLKATTMDSLAATLSMSKRTLYEVYGNKESLLSLCLEHHLKQRNEEVKRYFDKCDNAMDALYQVFYLHLQFIQGTSKKFFEDMDERFKDLRVCYDDNNNPVLNGLTAAIQKGIEQGVFRREINYVIAIRMMSVQMEALKRMENYFPEEITHPEVFNAIVLSFLRTIATPKGNEILDERIKTIEDPIINKPE